MKESVENLLSNNSISLYRTKRNFQHRRKFIFGTAWNIKKKRWRIRIFTKF